MKQKSILLLMFFFASLVCFAHSRSTRYAESGEDTVPLAEGNVIKVLAIGNSFSQDAVESYLHQLAEAAGCRTIIANMYIGGCSLQQHWENAQSGAAAYSYRKIGVDGVKVITSGVSLATALADEDWDYVSLQQNSGNSGDYTTYESCLPQLVRYVRERVSSRCRLIWHQTWAYAQNCTNSEFAKYNNDQLTMYRAIVDASRRAYRDNGFDLLIPTGTAVQDARTTFIGDRMNRDGYHLNIAYGRYTAACTWCEALFGSVMDTSYAPDGLSSSLLTASRTAAHSAWLSPDAITDLSYITSESTGRAYYVRADDDSFLTLNRDGKSWSSAYSWSDMEQLVEHINDGDTLLLAGGIYSLKKPLMLNKGVTIIGGFNPMYTSREMSVPDYPSATPTMLSGDVNSNGIPDAGDLTYLLAFDYTGAFLTTTPIRIRGVQFSYVYTPADKDGGVMGALYFKDCQDVMVDNCSFMENKSEDYGGSAVRAEYSTLHFIDCKFQKNMAVSRGGAVRLSSNSSSKGYTTFERCLFMDNEVVSGVGSAICVQHGQQLSIVNSLITGNKAQSGGAVFSNGADNTFRRKVYIISSTIAANDGTYEVEISKNANLAMTNSVIVGNHDCDLYVASVQSWANGGYNVLGSYSTVLTLGIDDVTVNRMEDVYGNGSVMDAPILSTEGVHYDKLNEIVSEWGVDADFALDYFGHSRLSNMQPGAVVGTTTDMQTIRIGKRKQMRGIFTLQGVRVKSISRPGIYLFDGVKVMKR